MLKLAEYHWERTTLFLTFDAPFALEPTDSLVLRGQRFDPELDDKPRSLELELSNCAVEDGNVCRVRMMLANKGNAVRSGEYQLFVRRHGKTYPVEASESVVHPQTFLMRRSDMLIYAKTSSYLEVVPVVREEHLWFLVSSKGAPARYGYSSKRNLSNARSMYVRALANSISVATFNFFKRFCKYKREKILFTSDSRKNLSGNMEPLYERMKERGIVDGRNVAFAFKKTDNLEDSRGLFSYMRLAYHLATSGFVFCDDFQPFLYHVDYHKGTRLVQLWHACGAFKTVGFGRVGTFDAVAPYTNDHRNYTDVIVASDHDVPIYAEAFGLPDECIKPYGIPRHDWLLESAWQQERRERFDKAFPQAEGKRVIVFAPTFRGAGKTVAYYDYAQIDFERLADFCREHGYFFIFKMHPFISQDPHLPDNAEDVFADGSAIREINDILPSTDVLVTDYSSVVYEAALLDIPTLYFAYDLEEYVSSRSFYEPYEAFVSGRIVRDFDTLLDALEKEDYERDRLEAFRKKNFKYIDGASCDRIIDRIVLGRDEGEGRAEVLG